MRHLLLILLLAGIAIDVLGNILVLGSWRNTMSATAWKNREHPVFGWCHRFIDAMPWFGKGHCQAQYERESQFGSVWAAWREQFKGA
jgi:hypothetical protein